MPNINKKILIVEDDKDFLSILKIKFTEEGFLVVTAENGEEGIETAAEENPDMIISDVLMPRLDGIEMAKKIKNANPSALIMFLTNLKDAEYIEKIKNFGGFDYIIKSESRISEIVEKSKAKLGIK